MKLSLICCALFCSTAIAASPPQLPIETMWAPSLSKQPSRGAVLGNVRITFEKTTLSEVMLAVLGGTVLHRGAGCRVQGSTPIRGEETPPSARCPDGMRREVTASNF